MRRRLSIAVKILLVVGLLVLVVISKKDHGMVMASALTLLKVTHLDIVVVLFGAIYYFTKDILPHIWPVVVMIVVGSALIVATRRRAGRDVHADRPTLLGKRDLDENH